MVWNSFFSFVKRGKGIGDGVPPGSGEACRQPQQAGAGGWVGRVLEFPTILFSAGKSKAGCPGSRREGQGPGGKGGGRGGLTLTCKVQLPHKLGCFSKSDIRINTQTQLHAHMRRRLCVPEGGDLGPPAPGSSKAGARPVSGVAMLRCPRGRRGRVGESSGEGCLFSELLSISTQVTRNQIHGSGAPQACAAGQACGQPVGWLEGPVSPLQGSGEKGCRQRRVKGARRDVLSPAPRGPGLREGGGASLISRPPWRGGPWVPRWPVGGPGAASLTPGKWGPESTGAAAAAGGAVRPLGVRPRLASWAPRSCRWR